MFAFYDLQDETQYVTHDLLDLENQNGFKDKLLKKLEYQQINHNYMPLSSKSS